MKKTSTLQNKIKAYSAIALSVAGMGALQSQVVYHDVNPDKVLSGDPETFDIDMDGNSVADFQAQTRLGHQSNVNNYSVGQNFIPGSLVLYTSLGYAQAFALGNPIGPTLTNWKSINQMVLASTWNSTPYGHFGDNAEHFMGCRFKIGGTDRYGWVRFKNIPQNGATMTIMDWAYKTTANTAINAGEGIVGIEENADKNVVQIFCANKKLSINFLNASAKGNIRISNIMGQEIKTVGITDAKMIIDLGDVAPGIYVTTVSNGKMIFTRKFNVK